MIRTVKGSISEVLAFRLLPGMDVLTGIKEACESAGVKNGVILSAIGSLDGAAVCNPMPSTTAKFGWGYGAPTVFAGQIELVSAAGTICHGDNGEVLLHIHCSLSDRNGNAYGGHMVEGQNKVLMTTDVVVGVLDKINMIRQFDEETGVLMFHPEAME